jgi:hypothetical protein
MDNETKKFLDAVENTYVGYETDWNEHENDATKKLIVYQRYNWVRLIRDHFDYENPKIDLNLIYNHQEKWDKRVKIWLNRWREYY